MRKLIAEMIDIWSEKTGKGHMFLIAHDENKPQGPFFLLTERKGRRGKCTRPIGRLNRFRTELEAREAAFQKASR